MATPADTSIQRRYTAGDCALDITSQSLALSKWYPQPVVQDLQFQLWMRQGDSTEPALLAEGDRTTLQAITQYVEQQVQNSLAIAHISATNSGATQTAPRQSLPRPAALQTSALSYLQLSDLSAVLSQYEQGVCTLPTELPIARPVAPSTADSTETSNVLPFSTASKAVRNRNATRRPPQRRRQTKIWASSAAAALFAVGLASALRPVSQNESQVSDQQITAARPERLERSADLESAVPEVSAAKPEANADEPPQTSADQALEAPRSDHANNTITQRPARLDSSLPSNSANPNSPTSSSPTPTAASSKPTPSTETSIAAAPSVPPSSAPSDAAKTPLPPLASDLPQSASPAQADPQAIPDIAALPAPVGAAQTEASRIESSRTRSSSSADISADEPAQENADFFEFGSDRDLADIAPSDNTARTGMPEIASARSQRDRTIDLESLEEVPTAAGMPPQLSAEPILTQIQNYFQTQWQSSSGNISEPSVSGSLRYQLQLSESGEVNSFIALNEAAQTYRNQLMPNSPLRFVYEGAERQMWIEITPEGQVFIQEN